MTRVGLENEGAVWMLAILAVLLAFTFAKAHVEQRRTVRARNQAHPMSRREVRNP